MALVAVTKVDLVAVSKVVWAGGPDRLGDAGSGDFSHAVGLEFGEMSDEARGAIDGFIKTEMDRRDG